jgi:hypothetical protein
LAICRAELAGCWLAAETLYVPQSGAFEKWRKSAKFTVAETAAKPTVISHLVEQRDEKYSTSSARWAQTEGPFGIGHRILYYLVSPTFGLQAGNQASK